MKKISVSIIVVMCFLFCLASQAGAIGDGEGYTYPTLEDPVGDIKAGDYLFGIGNVDYHEGKIAEERAFLGGRVMEVVLVSKAGPVDLDKFDELFTLPSLDYKEDNFFFSFDKSLTENNEDFEEGTRISLFFDIDMDDVLIEDLIFTIFTSDYKMYTVSLADVREAQGADPIQKAPDTALSDNLVEEPMPVNGAYALHNGARTQLRIVAPVRDEYVFIKVYDVLGGDEAVGSVFIHPGNSASIRLEPGMYYIKAAYGAKWYGDKAKFGPSGAYQQFLNGDSTIFFLEPDYVYTLTLQSSTVANVGSSQIDPSDF